MAEIAAFLIDRKTWRHVFSARRHS